MKAQNFLVIIEQDEDGVYLARVPDLPGCHTQAKTLSQLYTRIKEAISLCLEVQKKEKLAVSTTKFIGVQQLEVTV
ncbi:type II toxin-antitoxin system HicB family antitoxin [Patescibacteria group bacterium]|nr:type II toxin-antitoxin system HicB family antitoxin [Patescibacteria group bacterium]MBU1702953.1 type II toxin-antitoxin system HicB family antitoxin [Patescibacteria group bacterium]MBU1953961.1 type II toxin-antitoxin system HicB family antitoxin [Patescibacteria group bacterium]